MTDFSSPPSKDSLAPTWGAEQNFLEGDIDDICPSPTPTLLVRQLFITKVK
jgi:hypothetical protein